MPVSLGLLLEHADEFAADDLAFLLGIGHAGELVEETVDRVHVDEVRAELAAEDLHDLLAFALAHEAVVHVHAHELLADGPDEERGHDGAVDAAGEREQDFAVSDLLADQGDLFFDKLVGEFLRGDPDHVVGAFVAVHRNILSGGSWLNRRNDDRRRL